MSTTERSDYLLKIASGIEARRDELVKLESMDQGKPLWLAKMVDIPRAIQNMKSFANSAPFTKNM